jgi:ferrous iron transport protein B
LGYFPRNNEPPQTTALYGQTVQNNTAVSLVDKEVNSVQPEVVKESMQLENSYIGKIGHLIEPVISPLGFDWKIGVSILTGLAAKEIVVGSMGVLYQSDPNLEKSTANLQTKLQQQVYTKGPKTGQKVFTPLVAFAFMLFVLLYFPCVATITAIKREAGNKWAFFIMGYTMLVAWLVAFGVYQIGSLF